MKLLISALVKFICGIALVGCLVFLPAGTLAFWNGWLLMGLLFVPIFILGAVLFIKQPDLLKKRLNGKEKQGEQKQVVALSALVFLAGFVVSGLDYRFNLTDIPIIGVVAAAALFLLSYALYAEVMKENSYLSRTIEVHEGQKTIEDGLYGIVRHPMYFATVLMFLSIPVILGSLLGFLIFLAYPFIIAKRIKNEEKLLSAQLEGYEQYTKKVKYRLFPFIW